MSDAHRCLAAAACRNGEKIDDERVGAPTEDTDSLCPACFKAIESAVRQLPRDWADLRAALGERNASMGSKIRSTPTPAIPISTRKEALMVTIVETCERAAVVVSGQLHTDPPEPRRKSPPVLITEEFQRVMRLPRGLAGKPTGPLPGTPASDAAELVTPDAWQTLAAAIRMVEPNIDLLALAPAETHNVWAKPHRCDAHADLIGRAELMLDEAKPNERDEATNNVRRAYSAAGSCDDCNGWCKDGQAHNFAEYTGVDLALQLLDLHHQCRAELGLTRLRHRYPMPCPRCGERVGRDDGKSIITCDDRDGCKSSWTEREYQFLVGLITHERLEMETLRLLEGTYSRLDEIRTVIDKLKDDGALDIAGAGRVIAERIEEILNGEDERPALRTDEDRKATENRQAIQDAWTWENESPYRPPKRKPRKAKRPVGALIHPGSLTTLVDTNESDAPTGARLCGGCNEYHAGECA